MLPERETHILAGLHQFRGDGNGYATSIKRSNFQIGIGALNVNVDCEPVLARQKNRDQLRSFAIARVIWLGSTQRFIDLAVGNFGD